MRKLLYVSLIVILFSNLTFAQQVQKSVFSTSRWKDKNWLLFDDNQSALYKIITSEAFQLLVERSGRIAKLDSKDSWEKYQEETRLRMRLSIDKFEKTALNPQITGTLDRETFTVEKILFESHPGFFVTSSLFIPKNRQTPAPAIIYCAGHTDTGFRSEVYQRVILNLVEKGFVVFAFDPIGQGERLQYFDAESGKSKIGAPTTEHSYAGIQTLLTGTSLTDYFIWDAIRAIDFLETRKEVDIKRLGVTGRSGGGLQSALLMAYDDRIYAAAPECYITNFKRLLQSIGPQDAEQNPYNFIKNGFDIPDFLHLHAPKPALIITTTHDFFSIQGARETFSEVKKSYNALGYANNIDMVEDLGIHESTKANREALYEFFLKHLYQPGESTEKEIEPFSTEELWVTKTGQVSTALNGETVFSLNKKFFEQDNKQKSISKASAANLLKIELIRKLTASVYTGLINYDGKKVEKYFLENEFEDFALPVYLIKKDTEVNPKKLIVWLQPEGKEKVLDDLLMDKILELGYAILAPDLPGIGELHDPGFRGDGFVNGVPFNYTFGANLAGRSIPGIQAESIGLLMQFIEQDEQYNKLQISALVDKEMSSAFLHYAMIENSFNKIVFRNPLVFNNTFLSTEYYDPSQAFNIAPGSLPDYDFRNMVSLLAPEIFRIVNSIDENTETYENNILEYLK